MLGAVLLEGCATQGFDAQKGAAQFVAMSAETAQRVGFTDERQIEILKTFNCSNIRKVKMSWAIGDMDGDNCTVFGQKIPLIYISTVGVGITFHFKRQNAQKTYDVLKPREQELATIVFQGKANGVLSGDHYCYPGHYLCVLNFHPKFD